VSQNTAIWKRPKVLLLTLLGALVTVVAPLSASNAGTAPAVRHPVSPAVTVTWQFGTPSCRGGYCQQYLEIYHSGTVNGNWADVHTGNGTNTQKWASIFLGSGEYAFRNVNSGKCLEDPGYALTGHVEQSTCGTYPDNLRWQENYSSSLKAFSLTNVGIGNTEGACVFNSPWVVLGAIGSGLCFWH
jgi:hypothetical protein